MRDWTEFGLRHLPTMSAVEPFSAAPEMAPVIEGLLAVVQQSLALPVRGITSDGAAIPELFTSTAAPQVRARFARRRRHFSARSTRSTRSALSFLSTPNSGGPRSTFTRTCSGTR